MTAYPTVELVERLWELLNVRLKWPAADRRFAFVFLTIQCRLWRRRPPLSCYREMDESNEPSASLTDRQCDTKSSCPAGPPDTWPSCGGTSVQRAPIDYWRRTNRFFFFYQLWKLDKTPRTYISAACCWFSLGPRWASHAAAPRMTANLCHRRLEPGGRVATDQSLFVLNLGELLFLGPCMIFDGFTLPWDNDTNQTMLSCLVNSGQMCHSPVFLNP